MLKCIGYRFKSFHGAINGKQIDSDKLIFSYISNEDPNVFGWESHQIVIQASKVSLVFGEKAEILGDQKGNLICPELDNYIKKPIFISCSFDEKGKSTVNRVIIDPSVTVDEPESKSK